LYNQLILLQVQSRANINNGVGARGKKQPISDTSYSSLIRGPVATVGSFGVEGAEGGEERKELVLEDWGEWIIWIGIAGIWF
jgi:hypothetical protein